MKEKLKNSPILQSWFYTQSPLVITRPALRETIACVLALLGGFLLSCGTLSGIPAPFALALLASTGGGIRGLTCLIGATAGYLTMQPLTVGLQMVSSGILIYVCNYIFGSLWVTRRVWFRCAVAGAMTALVGLIFLLSEPMTLAAAVGYGQTVLLAGMTPPCYDSLLREKKRTAGSLLALCTFFLGAGAIPLPWGLSLGCVGAVAMVCAAARRSELPVTAVLAAGTGIALDTALGTGFWTLALGCGGLVGGGISRKYGLFRVLGFALALMAALLYTGNADGTLWLTMSLGVGLSFLLPAGIISGRSTDAISESAALVEERLSGGQAVLKRLYEAVGAENAQQEDQDANRVFDRAAARVCRRCVRCSQCWEREARETYLALRPVLLRALEQGVIRNEDFPREFIDRCIHMEELAVAINRELDNIVCRTQDRTRRAEERQVISRYLLHLSRLLGENARQLRTDLPTPQPAFTVKLGVAARGRGGNRRSGDRGASFRTEDGRLFVVLCDGAGAGEPAAAESVLAVDTLVELIQAGMPAENAMELLNGMYVLRDTGSFSTMDVLELSLLSGQGTLYKWGAAPSYVRSGNAVRRVGSAAPPPGLGAGGSFGPEVLRLNLWDGDMLVLASDGIDPVEAESLMRDFGGTDMKALANILIDRAWSDGGADDATVAVVWLKELR